MRGSCLRGAATYRFAIRTKGADPVSAFEGSNGRGRFCASQAMHGPVVDDGVKSRQDRAGRECQYKSLPFLRSRQRNLIFLIVSFASISTPAIPTLSAARALLLG